MRQLHSQNLMDPPDLPFIRDSEQRRFEKVVQYYFPGESAQLILGRRIPITARMARNALVDPNGSGNDFLKDGRSFRTVTLVVAVRPHDLTPAHWEHNELLIGVEDGTGFMPVEVRLNGENGSIANDQLLEEVCREHTYIRIIGQIEDFGGERRILATDVSPVSHGNEFTNHFLEVARSYDKYLQMQQQAGKRRCMSSDILASNTPLRALRRDLFQVRAPGQESPLHDAVLESIRTMGSESFFAQSVAFRTLSSTQC